MSEKIDYLVELPQVISDNYSANKLIWALRNQIANYNAKQIYSSGWYVNSKNKKLKNYLQNIFLERNKFISWLFNKERELSLFGSVIITIDNTPSGIKISPTWQYSKVGEVYVKETVAVVWKRIVFGTQFFFVRERWTTKDVERTFHGSNGEKINVYDVSFKFDKSQIPLAKEHHNAGFLPVHKFNNLNSYRGGDIPDWKQGEEIELNIYTLFETLRKEVQYNRTRIFGTFSDEIKNRDDWKEVLLSDLFIQADTDMNDRLLDILMGDPKIKSYTDGIKDLIDLYYQMAGFGKPSELTVQQSATKEIFMKNEDLKTVRMKRQNRELELKRMLWKVIELAKDNPTDSKWVDFDLKYEDFNIVIRENVENRGMTYMTDIEAKIRLGMMSLIDAIAEDRQISKEEAILILEEIKQEREENPEMYQNLEKNNQNQSNNQNQPNNQNEKNKDGGSDDKK